VQLQVNTKTQIFQFYVSLRPYIMRAHDTPENLSTKVSRSGSFTKNKLATVTFHEVDHTKVKTLLVWIHRPSFLFHVDSSTRPKKQLSQGTLGIVNTAQVHPGS